MLYLVTFLFILPVLCRNLRHTPYEIFFYKNETAEKNILIAKNEDRFNQSVSLLKKIHSYADSRVNVTRHQSRNKSIPIRDGIAVTLITIARNKALKENYRPHYLVQSVAAFVQLIKVKQKTDGIHVHFSICNVDSDRRSHTDMEYIPKWITVFHRFSKNNDSTILSYNALLDKEKDDYVFCLEKAFEQNLTYALLVEDDTLPQDDLFPVIKTKILAANADERRRNSLENVLYVKLYHPERLLGYFSIEVERLPELLCLAVIFSAILVRMYAKWLHNSRPFFLSANVFGVFFIYSLCVLFLIGRQNIMKFRFFSHHLYQMTPAPSCCTPAMLFPRAGGKVVMQYLRGVTCRKHFGKDIALDRLVRERRHITRLIQPNLFQHIGHYSSLRSEFINPFSVE